MASVANRRQLALGSPCFLDDAVEVTEATLDLRRSVKDRQGNLSVPISQIHAVGEVMQFPFDRLMELSLLSTLRLVVDEVELRK